MEESKPARNSGIEISSSLPPMPPQKLDLHIAPRQHNKRKPGFDIHNSSYYKIRALVHELRPSFLEVLRTPDFRNSKAAHEIKKQMKMAMDLYNNMIREEEAVGSSKYKQQPESVVGKEHDAGKLSEKVPPPQCSGGPIQGTYIVGGSVFGWNFITFPGSLSVYYGLTKEAYRKRRPKTEWMGNKNINL